VILVVAIVAPGNLETTYMRGYTLERV